MYVIMGASGHVGSATANGLIERGESVTVILHGDAQASDWRAKGADVVVADVDDVASLRAAFRCGRRAFLLNPPADTKTDTDAIERATVANILAALDGSGLEKVVAASTMGAQPGERIGDLGVLWEFEQGLQRQAIPAAINRAAYYMSNWDAMLEPARGGKLPTMIPADMTLPMVAPHDLGKVAADRLLSAIGEIGVRQFEGPDRYSANDVARAFADALARSVTVGEIPRPAWRDAYRKLGFSDAAADSYARMTELSVDSSFEQPDDAIRGSTTLQDYIRDLVQRAARDIASG